MNHHGSAAAVGADSLNPVAASMNPHAVGATAATASLNPAAADTSLNPGASNASLNPAAANASLNPAAANAPLNPAAAANASLNPAAAAANASLNPAAANASLNPTDADSLSQLNEALSCIDTETSKIYWMAVSYCPDLITKESNPISYLEFCKYDPWKAAKRICTYWELRYEIFGPERCFRPVTKYCSETGALSKVTIDAILETGHGSMLLPDNEGRAVMLAQRLSRQLHARYNIQSIHKMQAVFYIMQLVVALPNVRKHGVRGVFLFNEKRMYPSLYPRWQTAIARVLRDCFPIEFVSLHSIIAPRVSKRCMTPSYSQKLFNSTVPYIWNTMKNQAGFTRCTLDVVHVSTDDNKALYEEKLSKLMTDKLKLNPNSIPVEAGGSWNWERFKVWFHIQQNMLLQQGLPNVPAPILPYQQTNRNVGGSHSSPDDYKGAPSQDSGSFESESLLNNQRQLDASHHGESCSGTKRKMTQQQMPSVDAMAAVGALEPLPIWYGEADTTEQSTVAETKTAHLPEETGKRQRM